MSHGCGFAVSACCATFMPYVVCASSTTPAFMWTVLPWRLPIDGVPFPTAVASRAADEDYVVSYQTVFSPSLFWFSMFVVSSVFSKTRFEMLIETLQSSSEAFSAFESYKYDFAEVLLKNFGCHFAHLESLHESISSILELSTFKPYLA